MNDFRVNRREWLKLSLLGAGMALSGSAGVASVDDPKRKGRIFLTGDSGLKNGEVAIQSIFAFDPETGAATKILDDTKSRLRVSPDGRLIAFRRQDALWVRGVDDEGVEPTKVMDLEDAGGSPPNWSADSKSLIISPSTHVKDDDGGHWAFKTFRVNADGTDQKELPIPIEDGVYGWTPDGERVLTASSREAKIGWQLYTMKLDGTDVQQITEGGNPFFARLTSDGKHFLYADGTNEERRGIWICDFAGKERRKIFSTGPKTITSACFSPDGKYVAVATHDFDTGAAGLSSPRLHVMDRDGENRTVFDLPEGTLSDMPDWR